MKKLLLLFVVVFFAISQMFASPVDVGAAKRLGLKFAQNSIAFNGKNVMDATLVCEMLSEDGTPCIYVFNIGTEGFVMVAADDCVRPILGYSAEGNYISSELKDSFTYYLGEIRNEIAAAIKADFKQTPSVAEEWKSLECYGRLGNRRGNPIVGPYLITKWDQGNPYNIYCPPGTYTGCVATAMAQVMKYWDYPVTGTGSHSYYAPGYGTQTANFGETSYDWANMTPQINTASASAEIDAVAILSYHCGVAVNMSYGSDGSGAFSGDVPTAMNEYFSYTPNSRILSRVDFTRAEWEAMLRDNLDQRMPLYYSGADSEAGHAFVFDGYDDNNMFHVNWGWSGSNNGYFAIDASDFAYVNNQAAIFDLAPLDIFNSKPNAPEAFTVTPHDNYALSATISWINPTTSLDGSALSSIDKIVIRRNEEVIYEAENVVPGEAMNFEDNSIPYFDDFHYSIFAINNEANGRIANTEAVFGPSCEWSAIFMSNNFQGWCKGGISILNAAGTEVDFLTMANATPASIHFDVPLGNNSLVWKAPESVINSLSIVIRNSEGEIIYNYSGSSTDLPAGVMTKVNNGCGNENVCEQPINLVAVTDENDDHDIVLSWDGSGSADYGYCIYRDGYLFRLVSDNNFVDENTPTGGHCYSVTALCSGGESESSNEYCATSGTGCEPALNLDYEILSNGKVKLYWDAPESSEGLSGFIAYRKVEGGDYQRIKLCAASANSISDNSILASGSKYYYVLTSYFAGSECESARAKALHHPEQFYVCVNKTANPDNLEAFCENTTAHLYWDHALLCDSYNIYRDGVQIATEIVENNYLDTDLTVNESYCYTVKGVSEGVESNPSNEVCVTPTETEIQCLAPTNLSGIATCGSCLLGATISWSAPDGPTPDSYVLYRTTESSGEVVTIDSISGSATEYVELLQIGTYIYKLVARYSFDEGPCESDFALSANGEDFVKILVTSVSENIFLSSIRLYPNPTKDVVLIEADGLQEIVVYNIVGQCVAAIRTNDDAASVTLQDMQNGIYLFRIVTENGYALKKVILMR